MTRHIGLYRNFNGGFTLAEVLITLGIIGVVAALTMPAIIGNHNKQKTISQLKKVYSVLGQTYTRAIADYGDPKDWDEISSETAFDYFDTYWKPYLIEPTQCSNYKICGYERQNPFFKSNKNSDDYIITNNHKGGGRPLFYLNDGTFVMVIVGSGYGNNDRRILVDLNGSKPPNRFGNDVFFFLRTIDHGVVPYGYEKTTAQIDTDCSSTGSGYMCAAKLIQANWQMENNYPF